ncbi:MAG: ABC transporter ATP-binding protein [Chloroflexi bacterium]|nr:ABC transporter ATP-binding protein [Chloroflexota bacterium]
MIEIHELKKTYRGNIQALRGVSLDIGRGMFGLIGKNGAGKTTLMRTLTGLLRPTSGSISIMGHRMDTGAGKTAAKALLGYLPQELGLYPNLNAYEFLDYIAILKGVSDGKTRRSQIEQVLEKVNLTDVAGRQLKTYSGGMKRRIGIAQALLADPQVLIVDEPTAGLDPEERVRLRNVLSDVARTSTVILSTHIVEDIGHSCNDLAVINAGLVLYRGTPSSLIQRTQGHVWTVVTSGERPDDSLAIVSTQHLREGVQYRVVGDAANGYDARAVEPTLEDAFIWLMRER